MMDIDDFFDRPPPGVLRQWEALRVLLRERASVAAVAARFGYTETSVRNLRTRFLRDPDGFFDLPARRPPTVAPARAAARARRDEQILQLRRAGLSVYDIERRLRRQRKELRCSAGTVGNVLRAAGAPALRRRSRAAREAAGGTTPAARADAQRVDWAPRPIDTEYGGLFLFAEDYARLLPDEALDGAGFPGTASLPAGHLMRSLAGLKLWGIGRPSRITAEQLDDGLALFAGLNAVPGRTSLTAYSCRVPPAAIEPLMRGCLARTRGMGMPAGHSFDLDFHTIPYHGDQALLEKHYVSQRSRRQLGVLAFLARNADARVLCYANADVTKATASDEILRFAEYWKEHSGRWPRELVFDSGLTTYANLGVLDARGIRFLTLRRRHAAAVAAVEDAPGTDWQTVTLRNIGRAYTHPEVRTSWVELRAYPRPLRQLAVRGLGQRQPILLLTNQTGAPGPLIDRYARRMLIENEFADCIDMFHMDALTAAVPLRINLDLQLTVLAGNLYRLLGRRLGGVYEVARARKLFQDVVKCRARIHIEESCVRVRLARRTHNPKLVEAGYQRRAPKIPWFGGRRLRFEID